MKVRDADGNLISSTPAEMTLTLTEAELSALNPWPAQIGSPGRHQDRDAMSVRKLDPPMQYIACGRTAQYVIDGTSWCRIHKPNT